MALSVLIQLQIGNVWTDVPARDVVGIIQCHRGISDNEPTSSVASPGELRFQLANSTRNSGGLEGYYSPLHANAKAGFDKGIRCRLTAAYAATVSVTSLVRFWNTAIATTSSPHGRTTGEYVRVAGAALDTANGVFQITVVDATQFTYQLPGVDTLSAWVSESIREGETIGTSGSLYARLSDGLCVSDTISRVLGSPLQVAVSESMRISDSVGASFAIAGTITAQHTYVLFTGKIGSIDPMPGTRGQKRTNVVAFDGMSDLINTTVRDVALQVNHYEDAVQGAILDALPASVRPVARDLDEGLDLLPYALDKIGDGVNAAGELGAIARSSYGLVFYTGDGTYRYLNRNARATSVSQATFNNSMHGFMAPSTLDTVYNRVRTTVHPRTVDLVTPIVLWRSSGEPVQVGVGDTVTIDAVYRDPDNTRRLIGATNVITALVSSTDYSANSQATGNGTDLTAFAAITVTDQASYARLTITNTGASPLFFVDGTGANALQVRGYGVFDDAPQTFEATSAQSYGDRVLEIDLPYQATSVNGQVIADFVLNQYEDPSNQIDSITIKAFEGQSVDLLAQAFGREIGDTITAGEAMTGVASVDVAILSIGLALDPEQQVVSCTWGVGPIVTVSPPSAPVSLAAAIAGDDALTLTWSTGTAGSYTRIYRDGIHVATASIGATSYAETDLVPATSYNYEARHVFFALLSSPSNTALGRPHVVASGGAETTVDGYQYHTFTTSGNLTVTAPGRYDILAIAGGGGGGGSGTAGGGVDFGGGGGGGGGVLLLANEQEPVGVHAIVIGAGGGGGVADATSGSPGNDSTYRAETSPGGGAGALGLTGGNPGGSGGSGGGAAGNTTASGGSPAGGSIIGFAGGATFNNPGGSAGGGGGGGGGSVGSPATGLGGNGGARYSAFSGVATYAGGGKGGRSNGNGAAGAANTGDGGEGGTQGGNINGGAGGSGIVIIRYPI